MMAQQYPDFVKKKIDRIVRISQMPRKQVIKDYKHWLDDPFVQDDEQFPTQEAKQRYAIDCTFTEYISRPPAKSYTVIPMGYAGVRKTRSGNMSSSLYGLIKTEKSSYFSRIVCRGDVATLYRNVTLFAKYNDVKLGKFDKGNDHIADTRTRFEKPKMLNADPIKILKKVGAQVETLEGLRTNPSQMQRSGTGKYVDRKDWRLVRAMIVRGTSFERKDGTRGGVYTIIDDSIDDEPKVDEETGQVQRPGVTVWCAPEWVTFADFSECWFAGSVSIDDGEPVMNAYFIEPIHARETKTSLAPSDLQVPPGEA